LGSLYVCESCTGDIAGDILLRVGIGAVRLDAQRSTEKKDQERNRVGLRQKGFIMKEKEFSKCGRFIF